MNIWKIKASSHSLTSLYPNQVTAYWLDHQMFSFDGHLGVKNEYLCQTASDWKGLLKEKKEKTGRQKVCQYTINDIRAIAKDDLIVLCDEGTYYIGKIIEKEGRLWHFVDHIPFYETGTSIVAYVEKYYCLGLADSVPRRISNPISAGRPEVAISDSASRNYLQMRYQQLSGNTEKNKKKFVPMSEESAVTLLSIYLQKERGLISFANSMLLKTSSYAGVFLDPKSGDRCVLKVANDEVEPFKLDSIRRLAMEEKRATRVIIYDRNSRLLDQHKVVKEMKYRFFSVEYLSAIVLRHYFKQLATILPLALINL